MLNNAQEARQRALQGAAALRLVNELVPNALLAASGRGETVVRVDIDPIALKPVAGRLGRINDRALFEALDEAGHPTMAIACRKLIALGFSLSSVLIADSRGDDGAVVDRVRSLHIDHLILDYSTAQFAPARSGDPLLQGVSLKHAAHWRAEAQAQIALKHMEAGALSLIDVVASRGQMSCRIAWRDLSKADLQSEQFERLAAKLRGRGFQVDLVEAATAFRVSW
ncbi:MAG TPA: hypothetical protein VMU33_07710 [Burkholderiaceae bacterium]|nr:hypothetical protein [Burkholderiaceae bacterium]